MKKSEERFSETMVQLAKLEAKVDVLLKLFAEIKEDIRKDAPVISRPTVGYTGCLACGEYECVGRQGYLPCPNMAPYALTSGSLTDAGIAQTWREPLNDNDPEE